jgi:hypothetical protein
MRILLSLMNMFPPGEKHRTFIEERMRLGILPESALAENYEVFHAEHMLKAIKNQTRNKPLFTNQITIRYEDLINSPEQVLGMLESKFSIKSNLESALAVLSSPSKSSTANRYTIKSISDPKAIELMMTACSLWNYDFHDIPSTKVYQHKRYSLANLFRH